MAFEAGRRVSTYEILHMLGRGGMGEVYRAKDTRLGRDVALKILPASFTSDPERVARFRREAQILASLNHPHIGQIHGFDEAEGAQFLVLELVAGVSLDKRIARGRVPVDEALGIATQIAEALAAAHEQGIIHRDLKPANIAFTNNDTVKVLDFGLAKAAEGVGPSPDLSMSPTITSPALMTSVGVILGTAAYMSPEQAKGKPTDKRSDIWAFGCVLYEMLTGRQAFGGDSVTTILSNVLTREPDWSLLPDDVPARLRELLEWCLEKNVHLRRRDAGDLRHDLERALKTPGTPIDSPMRVQRRQFGWIVAAAAILSSGIALMLVNLWRVAPMAPEMRVDIATPPTLAPLEFALSPDGTRLVVAGPEGLWLRQLDGIGHVIAGTAGAAMPFWSPDSRSIGFFAQGALKRVDVTGAMLQTLAPVTLPRGGSWSSGGSIVFAQDSVILRVSAAGGEPRTVTHLSRGETAHRFPQCLSDGHHFLYYVVGNQEVQGIFLGSLDGDAPRRLGTGDSAAVPAGPDRIVFNSRGVLTVRRLDIARGVLIGPSEIIAESVQIQAFHLPGVSVSAAGTIAYRQFASAHRALQWYDRRGLPLGRVGEAERNGLRVPRLSPDAHRLALDITLQGNRDVWIRDLSNGITTRFTADAALDGYPVWSPDGRHIAFQSDRRGSYDIYVKSTTNADDETAVLEAPGPQWPLDWSRDGRFLLYYDGANAGDLWALPMTGTDRAPIPVARSSFSEVDGVFSPDGKWVAFVTDESGTFQVVVQPFPTATAKWQVSTNGGIGPRWSANGAELYFVASDGKLMQAPVDGSTGMFTHGPASPLFQSRIVNTSLAVNRAEYDVSADGRFLINEAPDDPQDPIVLILNRKVVH